MSRYGNIAKNYLSAEEVKLIENYQKEMVALKAKLSSEHEEFLEHTVARLQAYEDLATLAFDEDPVVRIESAKGRAVLLGAKSSRFLTDSAMDRMFDSTDPYVL